MTRAVIVRRIDRGEKPRPQFARRQRRQLRVASAERVERAGLDQALERPFVDQPQIEILAERVDRADPALLAAHGQQRFDRALADVLDRGEPEPDAALGLDGERQLTLVDVGRQHRNAAIAALAEVERQLVGVLRLDRQQRRREMPRVVRLQVRGLVREERVGRRVRLVEAVAGEVLHQLEDVGRPSSR